MGFGALYDRARIAVVGLAIARLDHVADQDQVVSSKNGSMLAVFGSGISSMSEASMPFQPAMDEPSKAWPELNLSHRNATPARSRAVLAAGIGEAEINELDFVVFTIFITSATVLPSILLLEGC